MAKAEKLVEGVKRFGYARSKKIKLYGKQLEVVSDPVSRAGNDVFVDAREEGSDLVKQVQIPRNVVQMAKATGRRESR